MGLQTDTLSFRTSQLLRLLLVRLCYRYAWDIFCFRRLRWGLQNDRAVAITNTNSNVKKSAYSYQCWTFAISRGSPNSLYESLSAQGRATSRPLRAYSPFCHELAAGILLRPECPRIAMTMSFVGTFGSR